MATTDELLSKCEIHITGIELAAKERAMLNRVLERCTHHMPEARSIAILCSERRADGWLEWTIQIAYNSDRAMTIGAIQRAIGAEVEFHS